MYSVPRLGGYLTPQCLASLPLAEWLNKPDLAIVDGLNPSKEHSRVDPKLQQTKHIDIAQQYGPHAYTYSKLLCQLNKALNDAFHNFYIRASLSRLLMTQ